MLPGDGPRDVTMLGWTRFRGQLLVAGPDLLDPNFRRSVLLVGEHGEEGAMGVVLNRPSPVVRRRRRPSARGARRRRRARPRRGARCSPRRSSCSATSVDPDEAGALVLGSIGFLPGEIESAADVGSLARARVFAGYAGWGPGQLESEIEPRSRGSSSRRCPRTSSPTSRTGSGAPSSGARAARSPCSR